MPRFGRFMVTVGGLGLMRPASGTWGSLPPAVLAAVFVAFRVGPWAWVGVMLAITLVFSLACIVYGDWAEAEFGKKDPGEVVADETAAMALTLAFVPMLGTETWGFWRAMLVIAAAFVAFRVMDILKPPPARGLQRVPGGWGILLDDLIAAVMAAIVVWAGVLGGVV